MKMPTLPSMPQKPKEPKAVIPKKAKEKKPAKVEAPEESVGLRVVSCAIAVLCISTACLYVGSTSMLVFLYLWGALTGSYVSFVFRHQKTFWLGFITSVGLLLVLGNFCEEVMTQFNLGKINALVPFIHVLTGLLSLHTFDLRAKSDINVSALIGLGLFACTAVLARDMNFAWITLTYITLVAGLLYYEAVARTQEAGAVGTSSEREEINLFKETAVKKRVSVGNAAMTLILLPIISIFVFLCLPRVDSLFDLMVANVRKAQHGEKLNFNWVKSESGWSMLTASQVPTDGKGPGAGSNGENDATNPGESESGHGPGAGGSGPGNTPGVGPGGKELKPGAGPGGTGSNPDALNLAGGSGDGKGKSGKGTGTKGSGAGGVTNGKKGEKGKDGKSGSDAGKPGKGKDEKKETAEKPPEPPPLPPGDREKTAEQEDQSLVFRNKESAEHDEELIMRVMSSRPTYYRRVCFDKYDGHTWTISSLGKISKCSKRNSVFQELAGVPSLYVEPGVHSSSLTQEITVEANIGHIIPAAPLPQQLSYPKDPVMVDQFGVMRSKDPVKGGMNYRVVSSVPEYDVDEMRKSTFQTKNDPSVLQNYLQLPADLNPQVTKLAKSVAGTDGNWFAKAERICNFLRRNYKYSDDLSDKSKEEISYHFLCRTKQGACGPFSTAFVVMCRSVGIPARCIGGFSPGDFNAATGIHEIKNKHGHAWAEVYVPGYEWVSFDATPTGLLPKPTPEDSSMLGSIKKTLDQLHDQFVHNNPAPPPLPPEEVEGTKAGDNQQTSTNQTSTQDGSSAQNVTGSKSSTKNGKETKESSPDGKKATDNSKSSKSGENKSENSKSTTPPKKEEPKAPPFNFNWRDWHEDVLLMIVIPAVIVLFQAIYVAVQQARKARRAKVLEKPKPSTMLYLKVVDDLARVKIHRLPTDTPADLMARFADHTMYEDGLKVKFHPELEPLCKQFMDLYIADRFGCDDASEMRANQMRNLSDQIHTLVRTKQHDN
ncbi:MAG TPA: transglutaminaseTgpA domain-containing protein [Drouetiella sp.]